MSVKTVVGLGDTPGTAWIFAVVALAATAIVLVSSSPKVAFYLDALDRSYLLYTLPVVCAAGLFAVLAYPRLCMDLMAFLLPFNFVGGYWGSDLVILVAKIAMNGLAVAALLPALIAPAEQRAWLTRTRLGVALLAWLAAIAMGMAVGRFSAFNPEYWVRESGWMLFFAAALPFGTLLRNRRDFDRLVWCTCAGVAALQAYGFWTLATGTRYARSDAWEAGASFFRAPYSCVSLFALYLAAAALLFGTSRKALSRRTAAALFAAIALLGGGLLASMVRSLWISGTLGMAVVLALVPWDRRTAKAAAAVAIGGALAIAVVAAVDRLSPASTGNWTGSAVAFLMDLGSKESTSRVTRQIEWAHAIEVWKKSPLVGLGFGYSYPQTEFVRLPDAVVPEAFYMHNSYLNILAKVGLFGLAALLAVMWMTAQSALVALRQQGAQLRDQVVATAVLGGLTSVALLTATMPVLTAGDPAAYLGMLIGMTAALRRIQACESSSSPPTRRR